MAEPNEPQTPSSVDLMTQTTVYHVPRPFAQHGQGPPGFLEVEVVGGPMDGLRKRVEAERLTIGRRSGNDLALPLDPMVSSRHARISCEGSSYWLEDLGSRNGTFVGDRRLAERIPIGPGITFQIGRTQVEFLPIRA